MTEQLISLKAAEAIWRRIETRLRPFEPHEILKFSLEDLQGLGLTRAKARSFQAIATAIHRGELNFDSLHGEADQDVLAKLLALPGIGPWTADIYLLTALGRADACPSGDLALQMAAQDLFAMDSEAELQGVSRKGRELEAVALDRGTAAVEPLPGTQGPFATG